jgi:soluble lytic murein transglycosylase-like protein
MSTLSQPRLTINRRGSRLPLLVFLLVLTILGPASAVQAEPYLRVCKRGVIYYYFSNRGGQAPRSTFWTPPRLGVKRPRLAKRLTDKELEPLIQEASRSHNLPPSLVKAVIRVESNFNPGATSPKGAQGLMQLMSGTADQLKVADPYDPRQNVWGGVRYLQMLLERFNNRLPLALAAYNAGPQRVSRRQAVPAIPETQAFVSDVCGHFLKYSGEKQKAK